MDASRNSACEPLVVEGALVIPYRYALGYLTSHFYTELRDHKRLLATVCYQCNKTYLPPVAACLECFAPLSEWTEVAATGAVTTYTVARGGKKNPGGDAPRIYAIIRLDGADTGLVHRLAEVDPSKVRIGTRVQAVFKEIREGNILDIEYFKPC